mmetsp:Transcript_18077/g.53507  ORF Transcript_18077/g.53507 Transcript_18077/m.53507 type:complete len:397 (+) Transcript_18077:416-1606(+)
MRKGILWRAARATRHCRTWIASPRSVGGRRCAASRRRGRGGREEAERLGADGDVKRREADDVAVHHQPRGCVRLEPHTARLLHVEQTGGVDVLAAALDHLVHLGGGGDRAERPRGVGEVEQAVVELRVRCEAVPDAGVLVDEAGEEEEVLHLLRRASVHAERAGQLLAPRQLEDLRLYAHRVAHRAEPAPALGHRVGIRSEPCHDGVDAAASERLPVKASHVQLLAVDGARAAADDGFDGGMDGSADRGARRWHPEHLAHVRVARARRDESNCGPRGRAIVAREKPIEDLAKGTVATHDKKGVYGGEVQSPPKLHAVACVLCRLHRHRDSGLLEQWKHDGVGQLRSPLLAASGVVDEERGCGRVWLRGRLFEGIEERRGLRHVPSVHSRFVPPAGL